MRHASTQAMPAVQGRAAARENESDTPVVPITVRQLEAVVRIAESYARMQLQVMAPSHLSPALAQINICKTHLHALLLTHARRLCRHPA